jgi:hypothetical protein
MTLPDLLRWMWEEEGTWYVNGFLNAWAILGQRQGAQPVQTTNGHDNGDAPDSPAQLPGARHARRPDGHPITLAPAAVPAGAPAWKGGPCDPICDFEDDGLKLIG